MSHEHDRARVREFVKLVEKKKVFMVHFETKLSSLPRTLPLSQVLYVPCSPPY